MSVDYTATLGMGYIISEEEAKRIKELPDYEEKWDGDLLAFNGYSGVGEHFFGEVYGEAESADYTEPWMPNDFKAARKFVAKKYGPVLSKQYELDEPALILFNRVW